MQAKPKQQATRMTAEDMRTMMSPTGPVHMDGMMGKSFTNAFIIKCMIAALVVAYGFDWLLMSIAP